MGRASFDLSRLRGEIKPMRLYWYPRLRSTNDRAAALRKAGELFAPAMVLTGRQTAGRGRGSNSWFSASGSLTVTFVFPIDEELRPDQLPLIAGLAVRHAVAGLMDEPEVQLKWPNDLVYRGRKIAGLLCERVHKADLIGLGLNVNLDPVEAPKELKSRLTSLWQIAGRTFDRTEVLIRIAKDLHRALDQQGERTFRQFVREYDQHHALVGKRVSVTPGTGAAITGQCSGIDDSGRLIVRGRGGIHKIVAGSVRLH